MKLTISHKISLGYGLAVIALLILSGTAYFGANALNVRSMDIVGAMEARSNVQEASLYLARLQGQMENAMLGEHNQLIKADADHRQNVMGQWLYGEVGKKDSEEIKGLSPILDQMKKPHRDIHILITQLNEILKDGDKLEAGKLFEQQGEQLFAELEQLLDSAEALIRAEHSGELEFLQLAENNQTLANAIGVTGLLITALMIILAFYLRKNITGFLNSAVSDLSTSASEISATAEEHEKVLLQQEASVTQATATMDELGASARLSTEHASSASDQVNMASDTAESGSLMVVEMNQSMEVLRDKVQSISKQIINLSDKTGQIENIITAVGAIASQTNMLALNAAVEAAHAGEQGKGFAVVAKEIRKLADQSKTSSERIAGLVREIQELINSTVMVAEDGSVTLESTRTAVNGAGDSFTGLAGSVGTISENVQQLALSAQQQATAIEQVVVAMNDINGGAKQSSAGLRQTRDGVEKLLQLSENILDQI